MAPMHIRHTAEAAEWLGQLWNAITGLPEQVTQQQLLVHNRFFRDSKADPNKTNQRGAKLVYVNNSPLQLVVLPWDWGLFEWLWQESYRASKIKQVVGPSNLPPHVDISQLRTTFQPPELATFAPSGVAASLDIEGLSW